MFDIEERLKVVERNALISKTRWATIIAIGCGFWTLSSGIIYHQLNTISDALVKLQQVESQVGLLNYRQEAQDNFNARLVQTEAETRRDLDRRFQRLEDQLNRIHGRSTGAN